jgi:hypothetical protein
MEIAILVSALSIVLISFLVVFNRQSKALNESKKISGRGGDFAE